MKINSSTLIRPIPKFCNQWWISRNYTKVTSLDFFWRICFLFYSELKAKSHVMKVSNPHRKSQNNNFWNQVRYPWMVIVQLNAMALLSSQRIKLFTSALKKCNVMQYARCALTIKVLELIRLLWRVSIMFTTFLQHRSCEHWETCREFESFKNQGHVPRTELKHQTWNYGYFDLPAKVPWINTMD